ncbi:MAG: PD40 domain-containing protein [Caldilineaceae bacterium]|nr:PD40 domain-containing protein [Caldilineaceae bacterium]
MSNSQNIRLPEWALWIIGTITLVAAAILILAVVLGVRAGQQQIEIQTRQQVGIHLQRAVDLRTEGNLEAALAEYQQVMLLDPGNVTAGEGVESLLALAQGNDAGDATVGGAASESAPPAGGQGSSSPAESEPTADSAATPAPTLTALEQKWADARAAYNNGEWAKAVEMLDDIHTEDPAFEADAIEDMLFNSYVNLSAQEDHSNNLEDALTWVDAALELRPNETQLRTARTMAANYLAALTNAGDDWTETVRLLDELYLINPTYRDVEERLQTALITLGDELSAEEKWCDAAEQYIAAIEIDVTPGLIDKRDIARDHCRGNAQATNTNGSTTPTQRSAAASSTASSTPSPARATPTKPSVVAAATDAARKATATPTSTAVPTATDAVTDSATATPAPTSPPEADAPTTGRLLSAGISADDNRSRIFTVPLDGGAPQLLVQDGIQPALRADGVRMAYYNTREDMAGISAVDPGTGLALRFTRFAEDRRPSWSPDGNRVAFASNREGDRRWRIYVTWAEENSEATDLAYGDNPAWHPTADQIVYRGCDETGNRCGLWTMSGAGSGRMPLTSVPEDTLPAWSPDGRYIVFTSNGRHGNYDIYRVDTQSGDVLRLTRDPANDGVPAISPNGRWVAFLSDRSGVWQIWGVPIAGGESVLLADLPGNAGNWLEQGLQWVR